jgi:hypothetical protein
MKYGHPATGIVTDFVNGKVSTKPVCSKCYCSGDGTNTDAEEIATVEK